MTSGRAASDNEFDGDAENVVQVGVVHGSVNVGGINRAFPVPRQLPLGVAGFVNRLDSLRELDGMHGVSSARPDGHQAVVVSAIAGAPGIGKTALAMHWAHQTRDRFPDGDLYVDMRGYGPGRPVSAAQALDGFLRAFNVPAEGIPVDLDERAALYRSTLDGKRVLVVIDNASSTADVRPLLPASRGCFVLITSRSTLSGLVAREGAARVTLDFLSPEESVGLLTEVIGPARISAERSAAFQVAELCGHLPLALRVVAERAADSPQLSMRELIEELVGEQSRLDALASSDDELSDVRAAFSWSYGALPSPLRRVFRLLGLHAGPEIGLGAAAALVQADLRGTARSMRALVMAHLVQEVSTARFRLHDLLRTYARERLLVEETQQERTQAVRRLLSWYLHATDVGRKAILPYSHAVPLSPIADLVIPAFGDAEDAMRWFDQERANILAALNQAVELGQYDIAWKLPVVADGFFELRSYWTDWETIHRIGADAADTLGDVLGQASNIFALGDADWRSGRAESAIFNYRRAIELSRDTGDRWVEGFALRGLGLIHEERQDVETASGLFRSALEVFQEGGFERGMGMALLSLGRCALAVGDLEQAVSYGERAVATFVELRDEWTEAWGTLPLATALAAAGRADEALPRLRHAAAQFARFQDHRSQAMVLATLGDVYRGIDELTEADECWRMAAELYELLGDDEAAALRSRLSRNDEQEGDGSE